MTGTQKSFYTHRTRDDRRCVQAPAAPLENNYHRSTGEVKAALIADESLPRGFYNRPSDANRKLHGAHGARNYSDRDFSNDIPRAPSALVTENKFHACCCSENPHTHTRRLIRPVFKPQSDRESDA